MRVREDPKPRGLSELELGRSDRLADLTDLGRRFVAARLFVARARGLRRLVGPAFQKMDTSARLVSVSRLCRPVGAA